MKIEDMHHTIDDKLNKLNVQRYDAILPDQKDMFINEAIYEYLNKAIDDLRNSTRKGFQDSQQVLDELRSLHVNDYNLQIDFEDITKRFSIFKLPKDYLHLIDLEAELTYDCYGVDIDTKEFKRVENIGVIKIPEDFDVYFANGLASNHPDGAKKYRYPGIQVVLISNNIGKLISQIKITRPANPLIRISGISRKVIYNGQKILETSSTNKYHSEITIPFASMNLDQNYDTKTITVDKTTYIADMPVYRSFNVTQPLTLVTNTDPNNWDPGDTNDDYVKSGDSINLLNGKLQVHINQSKNITNVKYHTEEEYKNEIKKLNNVDVTDFNAMNNIDNSVKDQMTLFSNPQSQERYFEEISGGTVQEFNLDAAILKEHVYHNSGQRIPLKEKHSVVPGINNFAQKKNEIQGNYVTSFKFNYSISNLVIRDPAVGDSNRREGIASFQLKNNLNSEENKIKQTYDGKDEFLFTEVQGGRIQDVISFEDYINLLIESSPKPMYWERFGPLYKERSLIIPLDSNEMFSLSTNDMIAYPQESLKEPIILTEKTVTGETKIVDVRVIESNKIPQYMGSKYKKTTLKSPIAEIYQDVIRIYNDKDFIATKITPEYIRRPKPVIHPESSTPGKQDLELDEQAGRKIINIAVNNITAALQPNKYQVTANEQRLNQ